MTQVVFVPTLEVLDEVLLQSGRILSIPILTVLRIALFVRVDWAQGVFVLEVTNVGDVDFVIELPEASFVVVTYTVTPVDE